MKSISTYMTVWLMAGALDAGKIPAPTAAMPPALSGAALLDDWGSRMTTLGTVVGENSLRTQIRTTIAQLAMFDAVNAAVDGPYHYFASKPAAAPGTSPEAAVIQAAYVVAVHEFPTPATLPIITAAYEAEIAALLASPEAIADGIEVGTDAADAVLAARASDHRNDPDLEGYDPASGPGAWSPTPPLFGPPQTPFLRNVTPFGYDDPVRFRPHAPPALDSGTYTTDYNEIKEVGRMGSTTRSPEQSATAQFWTPSATALWTTNVRSLAAQMDLLTAARFEAIGIAAVTNSLLAVWDAKYAYMFWRPVTAIVHGDADGNDATEPDPSWLPAIPTPSHPEYPAAHTTVGGGALGFYMVWFGTDELSLQVKGAANVVRTYSNFAEIRAEEGDARVWGGMHFRNSTEVGTALGSRVGRYTATHLLKRLDD
jgi:PAP2 superfamily